MVKIVHKYKIMYNNNKFIYEIKTPTNGWRFDTYTKKHSDNFVNYLIFEITFIFFVIFYFF